MTSLRDQLAQELVRRLDQVPGWVAMRAGRDEPSNVPVLALVYQLGESKRAANTHFYSCTLRLGIWLRGAVNQASASLDGGNAQRYLDRLVTLAERAVHSGPWANEAIVSIEGHEITPPSDQTGVEAEITVAIDYRHAFDDPASLSMDYVDA